MTILNKIFYTFYLTIIGCHSARLGRSLEEYDISNLRYAAFGTSVTYGSAVDREKETYMKLLSPTSNNLAIRASDPSFPATCTQSMIGDSIYDVIIVEYERRYDMGLENLVKRLRERFPDATIIVTNVWTFMNIIATDKSDDSWLPFRNWLHKAGIQSNTVEAWNYVKDTVYNNGNITFSFIQNRQNLDRDKYINGLVDKYNVKIFDWPKSVHTRTVAGQILRFLPLYAEDFVHWSAVGHKYAASSIQKIVSAEKTIKSDRLGTWGEGDVCIKWLGSGKIRDTKTLIDTNGKMVQFDDRYGGKFALEFPHDPIKEEVGYVVINNPFDEPRELALVYMTTGPAPSIYPKTELYIENSDSDVVEVDPTDTFYDYPVHVQFSKVIGKINPGTNKIIIHPLEVTEKPFRLVGFSITNESMKISKMYAKPLDFN